RRRRRHLALHGEWHTTAGGRVRLVHRQEERAGGGQEGQGRLRPSAADADTGNRGRIARHFGVVGSDRRIVRTGRAHGFPEFVGEAVRAADVSAADGHGGDAAGAARSAAQRARGGVLPVGGGGEAAQSGEAAALFRAQPRGGAARIAGACRGPVA